MPLVDKWRNKRRRARVARLRREINDISQRILRLHPDYDHAQISTLADLLVKKRQELAELINRKDS